MSNMNHIENMRDGRNKSIWHQMCIQTNEESGFLSSKVYDVLIVGAGITGATTALLLQKQGLHCILVDARNPTFGTTGATTAHINTFADTTYADVEKDFSEDASKQFADGIAASVSLINELINSYRIDCDFEWTKGYLYSQNEDESRELEDILSSSLRAGVLVQHTDQLNIPMMYHKAIVFDQQAQFHPVKYINGLLKEFKTLGGVCLDTTLIRSVETDHGIHTAIADNVTIMAKKLVYATHIPPGINILHFRNAPYRSYVIAATLADGNYPQGLIYDMQQPYHYYRTHTVDGQRYLIAGGHDHKTGHGNPQQAFLDLETHVGQYFQVDKIAYRWSSQYYVPADGLPYIGKLSGAAEGIYTATGYNGNGMILGSLAAIILSDLIAKGANEHAGLYDPARIKPIAGFIETMKENADVAVKFVTDRFGLQKLETVAEMDPDSGTVVEYESEKLAVYKDTSGVIHALNAVCTHAQCIVNWNNAEKTWDCPCHGARFATDGTVLTGPARDDLKQVHIDSSPAV